MSKNKNRLLTAFMGLAILGFILSVIVHATALLGMVLVANAMFLHAGIFVVFLPAVFVTSGLTKNMPRGDYWKLALQGCPPWMKHALKGLFVYAAINFISFILATRNIPRSHYSSRVVSPADLRGFSGHWMVFYFASYAILYSATHSTSRQDQECPRCKMKGTLEAKFCAACGAPLAM